MKFVFEARESIGDESLIKEAAAIAAAAASIPDLVFGWLRERGRSVVFCPGLDDDGGADVTLFILRTGGTEVGSAYVSEAVIKASYPGVEPVSNSLIPAARRDTIADAHRLQFMEGDYCNESWFDAQHAALGVEWNDDLCADTLKREAAISMALSYALARNGTASLEFRTLDDYDEYEDFDIREFHNGEFFHLMLQYHHEKNGLGFGSDYVVW